MSASLAYAVYDRPLAQPHRYGGRSLASRQGVLLRKVAGGRACYSEASPLPGHSSDTLAEVLKALSLRSARELLEASPGELGELPPSLRFALEGLIAQEMPGEHAVVSSALLASAAGPHAMESLGRLVQEGYRVVKIKIGAHGWPELLDLLEQARGLSFRLDANQSLDPGLLAALVDSLDRRKLLPKIEYLEEPFAGVWEEKSFAGFPLSLAADESAPNPRAAEKLFAKPNPPSVFIVKPTVAGGLFSLEEFLSGLRGARRKYVFTSALESEPGRRSLLAFLSRSANEPCGISTGYLFANNLLPDQSVWASVPPLEDAERRELEAQAWRECR